MVGYKTDGMVRNCSRFKRQSERREWGGAEARVSWARTGETNTREKLTLPIVGARNGQWKVGASMRASGNYGEGGGRGLGGAEVDQAKALMR